MRGLISEASKEACLHQTSQNLACYASWLWPRAGSIQGSEEEAQAGIQCQDSHSIARDHQPHRKEHRRKAHHSQWISPRQNSDRLSEDSNGGQKAPGQHSSRQRRQPHDYKYFARGMEMAMDKLSQQQPQSKPRAYQALVERAKDVKRPFLIHDVLAEMQLSGAPVSAALFLKAILGSISLHGGARPWEGRLVYDAMRRSGKQLGEIGFHTLLHIASGPSHVHMLQQVVQDLEARQKSESFLSKGGLAYLKFCERTGMTQKASEQLDRRSENGDPATPAHFKELIAMVRFWWRENNQAVSREQAALRVAELFGHAMDHCQLQDDAYQRDSLLTEVMLAYQELGQYDAVRDAYSNLGTPKMKSVGTLLQSNMEEAAQRLQSCSNYKEHGDEHVKHFITRCEETRREMDTAASQGFFILAKFLTDIMLVALGVAARIELLHGRQDITEETYTSYFEVHAPFLKALMAHINQSGQFIQGTAGSNVIKLALNNPSSHWLADEVMQNMKYNKTPMEPKVAWMLKDLHESRGNAHTK